MLQCYFMMTFMIKEKHMAVYFKVCFNPHQGVKFVELRPKILNSTVLCAQLAQRKR